MSEHHQICIEAALEAGKIISNYYEKGVEIRSKKSFDLVSDADLDAEKAIVRMIQKSFPDHSILAEEEQKDSVDAEHLWIVDPLDGTNNFAHHNPQFASSIAYFYKGIAVCSCVHNPILNATYTAEKKKGAFLNNKPIAVSQTSSLEESLVGTGFYYDRGTMMENTLETIKELFQKNIHGIRRLGAASLDLCYVASGIFDAYFEYKLAPWDFAGGALILEEAGGQVSNCLGTPLGFENTSILASNGIVHEDFRKIVAVRAPENK